MMNKPEIHEGRNKRVFLSTCMKRNKGRFSQKKSSVGGRREEGSRSEVLKSNMDVSLTDVSVEYPGVVLIEPSKLVLLAGRRYGLIGVSECSVLGRNFVC